MSYRLEKANSVVPVLRNIQNKKKGGVVISNVIEPEIVAEVKKGKTSKYIINDPEYDDQTPLVIDNMNYVVEPYIPISGVERFIIFLSGQSGTGKTALASLFIKQYIKHYNKNVFYVCETDKNDDVNLKPLTFIKQLPNEDLESIKITDLRDSLIFVDDMDYSPHHKQCMKFINMIVETGRKFKVSLIFASHINSKGNESCIYKELSMYLTASRNTMNNRLIEKYLNLDKQQIQQIQDQKDSAFICINKVFDCLITDRVIQKI